MDVNYFVSVWGNTILNIYLYDYIIVNIRCISLLFIQLSLAWIGHYKKWTSSIWSNSPNEWHDLIDGEFYKAEMGSTVRIKIASVDKGIGVG